MSARLLSRYEVKDEKAGLDEWMEREGKGELNIGVVGRERIVSSQEEGNWGWRWLGREVS